MGGSPNWAPGSKLPRAPPPKGTPLPPPTQYRRAPPGSEPSDDSSPPQAKELGLFGAGPLRARVAHIGKQERVEVAGVGAFGAQMSQTGGHHEEGGGEAYPEAEPTHHHNETEGSDADTGRRTDRAGIGASK